MLKLHLNFAFGVLEIDAEDEKELIEQAAFWQAMPASCPVCGASTRLNVRNAKGYIYREVVCTGSFQHVMKIQVHKPPETGLFIRDVWGYYDTEEQKDMVLWENGHPTSHVSTEPPPEPEMQGEQPEKPPTWKTSGDAVQWACDKGYFPNERAAKEAFTNLYNAKGKPDKTTMFPLWMGYCRERAA